MKTKPETYIFSACLSSLSDEQNAARTVACELELLRRGVAYKRVHGVYKGTPEASFVVTSRADALDLASLFGQESVLYADPAREAFLLYHDGRIERIGRLVGVHRTLADTVKVSEREAYTYCPANESYYFVR